MGVGGVSKRARTFSGVAWIITSLPPQWSMPMPSLAPRKKWRAVTYMPQRTDGMSTVHNVSTMECMDAPFKHRLAGRPTRRKHVAAAESIPTSIGQRNAKTISAKSASGPNSGFPSTLVSVSVSEVGGVAPRGPRDGPTSTWQRSLWLRHHTFWHGRPHTRTLHAQRGQAMLPALSAEPHASQSPWA